MLPYSHHLLSLFCVCLCVFCFRSSIRPVVTTFVCLLSFDINLSLFFYSTAFLCSTVFFLQQLSRKKPTTTAIARIYVFVGICPGHCYATASCSLFSLFFIFSFVFSFFFCLSRFFCEHRRRTSPWAGVPFVSSSCLLSLLFTEKIISLSCKGTYAKPCNLVLL